MHFILCAKYKTENEADICMIWYARTDVQKMTNAGSIQLRWTNVKVKPYCIKKKEEKSQKSKNYKDKLGTF